VRAINISGEEPARQYDRLGPLLLAGIEVNVGCVGVNLKHHIESRAILTVRLGLGLTVRYSGVGVNSALQWG